MVLSYGHMVLFHCKTKCKIHSVRILFFEAPQKKDEQFKYVLSGHCHLGSILSLTSLEITIDLPAKGW